MDERGHEAARGLPDVAAGPPLARFWSGVTFTASGIGFTLRNGRLLRWSLIPMAVHVTLFIVVVVAGVTRIDDVVARFGPDPGHWYSFVGAVLGLGLAVALVFVSALASLLVGGVVCDPFYDVLAEQTEALLLGRDVGQPLTAGSVLRGIVLELWASASRLVVYLLGAVPLWILGLTGAGSIVAAPASLAWAWLFVALTALSRGMARHALPGSARLAAVFSQKACALGVGCVGWMLAYVPFTAPLLVVGGTRFYLALAAWDRVPSSLTEEDKRALRGSSAPERA